MKLCVFCGSNVGRRPLYADVVRDVGATLAREGVEIIYGGGRIGLMGILADAALGAGGRVTGVIPRSLAEREIAHDALTDLVVVETMHERKAAMADLATGFVALPGGPGTLEEIFEQWTWAQLGIHNKPCGFLDVGGYFAPLQSMISQMLTEGFLSSEYADMLLFDDDFPALLARFKAYVPPPPKFPDPGAGDVLP